MSTIYFPMMDGCPRWQGKYMPLQFLLAPCQQRVITGSGIAGHALAVE